MTDGQDVSKKQGSKKVDVQIAGKLLLVNYIKGVNKA